MVHVRLQKRWISKLQLKSQTTNPKAEINSDVGRIAHDDKDAPRMHSISLKQAMSSHVQSTHPRSFERLEQLSPRKSALIFAMFAEKEKFSADQKRRPKVSEQTWTRSTNVGEPRLPALTSLRGQGRKAILWSGQTGRHFLLLSSAWLSGSGLQSSASHDQDNRRVRSWREKE